MITSEEIKRLAKLSGLRLDESEIPGYITHLSHIVSLLMQAQKHACGVHVLSHTSVCPLREDTVTETNRRDLLQAQVTEEARAQGLYRVPPVIESS